MRIINESFLKVISDKTSKFTKIHKSKFLTEGEYPIVDQSQEYIGGYTNYKEDMNYLGEPVIIFGDHTRILKYVDFPFAIGADGVKVLHVNKDKLNPLFTYYYLKSLDIPSAGYSRHFKFIKNKKLNFPESLKDQKRIAQVLSNCESLILKRKESIALLDELLKSTFLEMFGDPVRNEKNWSKIKISELIKVGTGSTPSRKRKEEFYDGSINWAKTTEVNGTRIYQTSEKITALALKNSNCKIYPVNTILMAMYGQGKTRGNVGLLKIEAATNQACAAIKPSDNVNQIFLFELFKNSYLYLRSLARGGNQENLNLKIVGNLDIIYPPIKLQDNFESIVEKIETIKQSYQTHLQELENLYGSISQKAFKGELDLSELNELNL